MRQSITRIILIKKRTAQPFDDRAVFSCVIMIIRIIPDKPDDPGGYRKAPAPDISLPDIW